MENYLSKHFIEKVIGHFSMLLFSLIVAGSFSFGKLISGDIDPIPLTAARFFVAALVLGVVLTVTGKWKVRHYASPWRFLLLGSMYAIFFVFMFEALKTSTVTSTSAIFTLMPLMAMLLDWQITGRRQSYLVVLAILIGAIGALWIIFNGRIENVTSLKIGKGEVLFFFGTLSHAAYAVFVPILRRGEPIYATTFGVALGGAFLLCFIAWQSILNTDWTGLRLLVFATILYLAIFASLGTFSLITIASSRLSSTKVTAYTYMIPFWVVLLEYFLGHGWPGFIILSGGMFIFAALIMLFREAEIVRKK